jgi:hypothetical protein
MRYASQMAVTRRRRRCATHLTDPIRGTPAKEAARGAHRPYYAVRVADPGPHNAVRAARATRCASRAQPAQRGRRYASQTAVTRRRRRCAIHLTDPLRGTPIDAVRGMRRPHYAVRVGRAPREAGPGRDVIETVLSELAPAV